MDGAFPDLNDPIAELHANIGVPFEQARAMPKSVYTSEAFLEAELEHIFRKDWFCVGRHDALAPDDTISLELAGQPVDVSRDANGTLSTSAAKCEEWLGWIMVTLNPDAAPVGDGLAEAAPLIENYGMEGYAQTFFETHVWDTNWKILAENFMESYHLPVCHAGTIGGLSKLEEMICPPGLPGFNYHTILKDDTLKIALAHPDNTRMKGDERRTTFLLAIYPSLLITLTPGYFWYLSLHPKGVGQVSIRFGGGMSPDYVNDPEAQTHFKQVKALLDDVNVEDKGCTEKVFRGLSSDAARPGHLSHLERPNYDFAHYLASRMP